MLQNDFEYWRGCRGSKNQLANYTISSYSLKVANIVLYSDATLTRMFTSWFLPLYWHQHYILY